MEAVTGVCGANFEAGSPGVLNGEPDPEPVETDLTLFEGDSGLGDVFEPAPT